ncbi:TIGR02266 family protein [Aggregicoccus sp. 17bor-14]|uniref:TIGR02266 family protein n=1 Tax=Myxococcaceae TaxID=31 RepID=UPI00129C6DB8|nr:MULTISPECIES: TIGR02266 family protein [Myxococcaceae]MBF5040840.1 TIGR02266 family protein [Simulacricoccus sp. 17bor-14]MRI86629.1 TIGR02266 family protein [Aggregicoccus sp. 17bor-14]
MDGNRRHKRIPSRLRCWCEGDNVTFYARVGDLSEGGLFLRTSTPLARGSRTLVRLHGEDRHELRAEATVIWARSEESSAAQGGEQAGPPGMGLQFAELAPPALEHLRRILAQEQRGTGALD